MPLRAWQDNLDAPVVADRDHGPRGAFDDQATAGSPPLWAVTHERAVGVGTLATVAAAAAVWAHRQGVRSR